MSTPIYFVGFITELERKEFIDPWTNYAGAFPIAPEHVMLQEKTAEKGKYRYISRHQPTKQDFNFSFMKGRTSENFSDHKARVVMLGGYSNSGRNIKGKHGNSESRIVVLTNKDLYDTDPYTLLVPDLTLTVYEPFFENCKYSSILEFGTKEADSRKLIDLLKQEKAGEEIAVYKTCRTNNLKGHKASAQTH